MRLAPRIGILLLLMVMALNLSTLSYASYNITSVVVRVALIPNTSARVNETIKVVIVGNSSVSQYSKDRYALNLTVSNWQQIINESIQEHIVNPKGSIYGFSLIPGPVVANGGINYSYIILSYYVSNVTTVNQTSPRVFLYKMNPNVLNFEHGASGEILNYNTTLTISVPGGAQITSAYPLPDFPPYAFTSQYKNTTSVSWYNEEPLSNFKFQFVINEPIREEVTAFFSSIYRDLGIFSYVIIVAVILGFVFYAYFRATK